MPALDVDTLVTTFELRDKFTATANKINAANSKVTGNLKNSLHNLFGGLGSGKGGGGGEGLFGGIFKGLQDGIGSLSSALPGLQEVLGVFKGLAIAGGAVGAGLLAFGIYAMRAAGDLEALKLGLKAYLGTTEATEHAVRRLGEVARLPGLGFKESIEGATRLMAVGFDLRLAERALQGFGNAIALVGGGKDDLDGVILALQQIVSLGKVTSDNINQIANRMPQIRTILKTAFGTADTEEISKRVGVQEFVTRVVDALETLPKATGGAKNFFENLEDTVMRVVYTIGDALNAVLIPAFNNVTDFIDYLVSSGEIQSLTDAIMGMFGFAKGGDSHSLSDPIITAVSYIIAAIEEIPKVVEGVREMISAIVDQVKSAVNTIIDDINDFKEMIDSFRSTPLGAAMFGPADSIAAGLQHISAGPAGQAIQGLQYLGSDISGRAGELREGFSGYKPSNEVANDPTKGGFTDAEQRSLTAQERTAMSAEQLVRLQQENVDLQRRIMGGGGPASDFFNSVNLSKKGANAKLNEAVNLIAEHVLTTVFGVQLAAVENGHVVGGRP